MPSITEGVRIALNEAKDVKDVKFDNHEFIVKKITTVEKGEEKIGISGQISHKIIGWDDQVNYTFLILKTGEVQEAKVDVDKGGLIPNNPLVFILTAAAGGAGLGLPFEALDIAKNAVAGTWEAAVVAILHEIIRQVTTKYAV